MYHVSVMWPNLPVHLTIEHIATNIIDQKADSHVDRDYIGMGLRIFELTEDIKMTMSHVVIMSPCQYEHHIECLLVSVATTKCMSQYIIMRPHPLAHIVYNRCKIYSNISNKGHDILMDLVLEILQQHVSRILSYNERVWFKRYLFFNLVNYMFS